MRFESFTDLRGLIDQDIEAVMEGNQVTAIIKRESVDGISDPGFGEEFGSKTKIASVRVRIESIKTSNYINKMDKGEIRKDMFVGIMTDRRIIPRRGDLLEVGDDEYKVTDATPKYGFSIMLLNKL